MSRGSTPHSENSLLLSSFLKDYSILSLCKGSGVMTGADFDSLLHIACLLLHTSCPGAKPCFSYTATALRPGETPVLISL